ncbi:MAG: NAD(P)/FAD-dependent oxidoreductase [Parvibaculaceae bacterium]
MTDRAASTCDVLVIGAGAYGLSTAWFLSEQDRSLRIQVVDASDFAGNGTGRAIGGVRTQWGHDSNIRMSLESVEFFEQAAETLDYPQGIELKQQGYLILAWDEETLRRFKDAQVNQHKYGIESHMLDPDEVLSISPHVNPEGLVGGAFCQRDGTISPFRWLDALLGAVRRRGVTVTFGCRVESLRQSGRSFLAKHRTGTFEAAKVVVCTDWAAPDLIGGLGIDYPIRRTPVEIMVTEPYREMLGPVHISMRHKMAINQMVRGSIVINHGRVREKVDDIASQPDWFQEACQGASEVIPALGEVNVLRGWAGTISVTPDMQPILCETPVDGLYVAVSAYKGLMTSPAAGRLMADLVCGTGQNDPILPFVNPIRFSSNKLVREPMTNSAKMDD